MLQEPLATHQKAFAVNMDLGKYGAFAEIGAGQEVARWFFRAGGAAGTVAKTVSAYDMDVSNSFYGKTDRYVSRQRLQTMLDYEYGRLQEELDAKRGDKTTFFVFADTVAATSFTRRDEAHGWMGMKFQRRPRTEPSQIIIHMRLLDRENLLQQEALGIMGVNLVYGAFFYHGTHFISSMLDGLTAQRAEVDMIKFSGPAFAQVDNRLMSLQLVSQGLTDAVMFRADGETVQPAEVFYKKAILVERGSFRPVTYATNDMLEGARRKFLRESGCDESEVLVLMEMTLENLLAEGQLNHADFLARVDILGALGRTVLISKFGEYYRLASYLTRHTSKMVGLVMGVPSLMEMFDEKYYLNLEGGILEALGRMFKGALKLYVYPMIDERSGKIITASQIEVAPNLKALFQFIMDNNFIVEITDYHPEYLRIFPPDALTRLQTGDSAWEKMVPPEVTQIIKQRGFFGYRPSSAAAA